MPAWKSFSKLGFQNASLVFLYSLSAIILTLSLATTTYIAAQLDSAHETSGADHSLDHHIIQGQQQRHLDGSITINNYGRNGEDDDTIPSPDLLLSVPFYVYEELIWTNATINDEPIPHVARHGRHKTRFKHSDDYWFYEAAMKHPMRTKNIYEAKLFFVPIYLNFLDYAMYVKRDFCNLGACGYDLLLETEQKLKKHKAFQKHPERHVIVRSFYTASWDRWYNEYVNVNKGYQKFMNLIPKMSCITFEGKEYIPSPPNPARITLPSYYVGTACNQSQPWEDGTLVVPGAKPFDVAMIATLKEERAAFQDRRNVCSWLNQSTTVKTSLCGPGKRCPALSQSKFGIHAAGDTFGSQRLIDTMLSESVPIFTHLDQYNIQGPWIDWKQLSYYLPVHDDTAYSGQLSVTKFSVRKTPSQEAFLESLQKILDDKEGYESRRQKILEHNPLFDHETMYPFDTYMYLIQAELFPETRQRKSRWSALLLPPPLFDEP
ncbi:MAG: hypothetical protein SGBAC_003435 [Bacillariaceae sp.]